MGPVALVPASEAVVLAREAAVKAAPMERNGAETAAVRCVGEIWLAEDSRAQQCSCNAHDAPTFARPGFAIV
jgi:hypothetical protein